MDILAIQLGWSDQCDDYKTGVQFNVDFKSQVQPLTSLLNFGDDYRKYIDRCRREQENKFSPKFSLEFLKFIINYKNSQENSPKNLKHIK